jgi:rhodanese-related sulfurtransferase
MPSTRTGLKIGASLGALVAAALLAGLWFFQSDDALAKVHQGIVHQFPEVEHISADEFARLEPEATIVFDTREPSEFAVSHIDGAIRIDPEMTPDDFLDEFGEMTLGKTVVFYCSVGARSTALANRVQDDLLLDGSEKVANLENGLFGWHNGALPLVDDAQKPTEAIHPFDSFWGRLIERKSLIQE